MFSESCQDHRTTQEPAIPSDTLGMSKVSRDQAGFTLIELAVTLAIVAILMTIGVVSYTQMARIADNKGVQLNLLTAVKVQALQHLETGEFTADQMVLFDLEPTLRYSTAGDPAGTIVVKIEADQQDTAVCLFVQSERGPWFSMYHSVAAGDRYGQSAPIPCTSPNVASWSRQAW